MTQPRSPLSATNETAAVDESQATLKMSTDSAEVALNMLYDVEVEVAIEIGRRRMKIADILSLSPGQTLELQKAAGEPLDVLVNGKLIGRGEAIAVGDRYGIRITEILDTAMSSRAQRRP